EWVHVQLHQQKGMISLSPPTICNSALSNRSMLCSRPTINPHDLLIGMGKSGGMSIHGTWQDPVCKTWRNTGNHMYPSIPTGWAMDSVLVLTWSLFADIRTEVSKMAGCAGELE
ncbi:hypothetical protein, partial [Salmonella sp. SAL00659]|uniref:hypothetical protein n=1 Tax=Salmonella sp. SAL00659 TaxID=3159736 RepID=UPI00397812D1